MTFEEFKSQLPEVVAEEDQYKRSKVTKTYTLTGSPDLLHDLERFMAYLQWCALHDHTADLVMHVDGAEVNFLVHGMKLWGNSLLRPRYLRVEKP